MDFIVIDKSWLQSANSSEIEEITSEHRLLMPAALMYELFTTEDESSKSICFGKLLAVQNSIDLIDHVGSFIRFESDNQEPSTPIQTQKLPFVWELNPRLTEPNYPFTEDQKESIEYFRRIWEIEDVKTFRQLAAGVTVWFPEIEALRAGSSYESIQTVIELLTTSSKKVKEIYQKLSSTKEDFYPPSQTVTEDWALYRWLQINLIYSVEYTRKYGAGNADMVAKCLPNDRLDREYIITGTLAKALATRDNEIRKYFKLCCPNGHLY